MLYFTDLYVCVYQITQDDMEREFMPGRRRKKFTKEDAIYGLWAEHDSDEERGFVILLAHVNLFVYLTNILMGDSGYMYTSLVGKGLTLK